VAYELFWTLNPQKLKPFIKAYELENQQWSEKVNITAWLNGFYITRAIAAVLSEDNPYFETPLDITGETKRDGMFQDSEIFNAYAAVFNKEFDNRQING